VIVDDIQALTGQLARDPSSLVFLPLAEALRRRGQLDSALTVAEQGTVRYPEMAGAYDLLARIRSDRGEGDLAFDAWTTVLRLDPDHVGAHKGLSFLCFRAGDHARSLRYLEHAVELAPEDAALRTTLGRVRELTGAKQVPGFTAPAPDPLRALEAEPGYALLVDREGRVLAPFSREDCVPLRVDRTLEEVKWKEGADLSSLAGKPVRFRFHLKNGRLYAFWVSPDRSGSSGGYLAAGGPGYPGRIDTVGRAAAGAGR